MRAINLLIFIAASFGISFLAQADQTPTSSPTTKIVNLDTDIAPFYILEQLPALIGSFNSIFITRIAAALATGWFDAIAPFQPTAVGLYSNLRTDGTPVGSQRNKNIALLFASIKIANSLIPTSKSTFLFNYLANAGIDPSAPSFVSLLASTDLTTPYGIGNTAGAAVVAAYESDLSNQLGKAGNRKYNLARYRDSLGYKVDNDPRYWQPNGANDGNGVFNTQVHVAPQIALLDTISVDGDALDTGVSTARAATSIEEFATNIKPIIDALIETQAGLTDYQKIQAEFYHNKGVSYLPAILAVGKSKSLTLDQFIFSAFTGALAGYEAGIIAWKGKIRLRSARPFNVVRYLYPNTPLTSWGGPGKGVVTDVLGKDWAPYIGTPAHTSYPSGSAIYFSAFAHSQIAFFNGDDTFNFVGQTYGVGKSTVEPGVTPSAATGPIAISVTSFTQYEHDGGYARYLGGIHFLEEVEEAQRIGRIVGPAAYAVVQNLIAGNQVTAFPSAAPTSAPAVDPTAAPTHGPIAAPTKAPSLKPVEAQRTTKPSRVPVKAPTTKPSPAPSKKPTKKPTRSAFLRKD